MSAESLPLGNRGKTVAPLKRKGLGGRSGASRVAYTLRDSLVLGGYQPRKAQRGCGRWRRKGAEGTEGVELRPSPSVPDRLTYVGLQRCASPSSCPVCALVIATRRAEDLRRVVGAHEKRGGVTCMITSTIRHGAGKRLRTLRRGLVRAFGLFRRRRGVARLLEGVEWCRAMEVMHGWLNGWHPHLHLLLLLLGAAQAHALEEQAGFLASTWADCVASVLGEECRPDLEHGLVIGGGAADYLSKIDLEVSLGATKEGRNGHRTPWQIAADLVEHGRPEDEQLWLDYVVDMKNAHQLEPSGGFWAVGEVEEKTEEEIVNESDAGPETVAVIPWPAWSCLVITVAGRSYELRDVAERAAHPTDPDRAAKAQAAVDEQLSAWAKDTGLDPPSTG